MLEFINLLATNNLFKALQKSYIKVKGTVATLFKNMIVGARHMYRPQCAWTMLRIWEAVHFRDIQDRQIRSSPGIAMELIYLMTRTSSGLQVRLIPATAGPLE